MIYFEIKKKSKKGSLVVKKIAALIVVLLALVIGANQSDIISNWVQHPPPKSRDTASQESGDVIYKQVDENGVVSFTNKKPINSQNFQEIAADDYRVETIKVHEEKLPPVTASKKKAKKKKPGTKKKKRKNDVTLYTSNHCVYCKESIAFLRSYNIPFKEYNIDKSTAAKKKMRTAGGNQYVPFAVINGKKILGFSETSYAIALNIPKNKQRKTQKKKQSTSPTRGKT
ncbi:MAG: glutaredoxin family protein [Candidatus Electrothrix sp. AR3]|nr:glutaredoxin family protein [Candidatus Electrothrix sp. AR3]